MIGLRTIGNQLRALIFPPSCFGCDVQLLPDSDEENRDDENQAWCSACRKAISFASVLDRCQKCGAIHFGKNPHGTRCRLCFDRDFRFESAIALHNYDGLLREVVVRMKSERDDILALQLGRLLAEQLDRFDIVNRVDLIIPVPAHWSRRLSRGFQATELIAAGITSSTRLPCNQHSLFQKRRTEKQSLLSTTARFKNIRNSFAIRRPERVKGKSILLIDDVMTSGATVSEATRTLIGAGAARVYVGVVARGVKT